MNTHVKVARVIAGLYNHARAQGMGWIHFTAGKLSPEKAAGFAAEAIREGHIYFDYLGGRVMKISVEADGSVGSTRLYDRDNGFGAADAAIADGLTDPYYDVLGSLTAASDAGTVS